jgi:hypothetical protein
VGWGLALSAAAGLVGLLNTQAAGSEPVSGLDWVEGKGKERKGRKEAPGSAGSNFERRDL